MKHVRRIAAFMMLLAGSTTAGYAQGPRGNANDSVDYSPATKTVAGTLPVSDAYTLEVISPSQLNNKGMQDLPAGIGADLRINVASYPDGSSAAEAAALVSLDVTHLTFYNLSETQQTIVHVKASGSTTPGDYAFDIQAVGPTGIGWGIANHRLNVSVGLPVFSDTTPPDVTITSPADGAEIRFCTGGTTIPVAISATDVESFVTAIGATSNGTPFAVAPFAPAHAVTANGSFTATDIGAYAIEAWATNAAGLTGYSSTVNVAVKYAISWLPPLSLGRTINGAVAIKFAARDCNDTFVTDTRVRVEVSEGSALRFSAVFGDGNDAVRIEEGTLYITNFHPPSGNHTYVLKVFFNNLLQASTNFSTR
jgi:hypothetical protein